MKIRRSIAVLTAVLLLTACASGGPAAPGEGTTPAEDTAAVLPPAPEDKDIGPEAAPEPAVRSLADDCTMTVGELSLSVGESKEEILTRLEEAGLGYLTTEPDDPQEAGYELLCALDEAWIQIFFQEDACVRLRAIGVDEGEAVRTARGLRAGDTVSRMEELYGTSFEKRSYADRGLYTVYRYDLGELVCECGVPGEDRDLIYNVDVYLPSQAPIYDYGEELPD